MKRKKDKKLVNRIPLDFYPNTKEEFEILERRGHGSRVITSITAPFCSIPPPWLPTLDVYGLEQKVNTIKNGEHLIKPHQWNSFRDIRKKRFEIRQEYISTKSEDEKYFDLNPPSSREMGYSDNDVERLAKHRVKKKLSGAIYDFARLCSTRPLWSEYNLRVDMMEIKRKGKKGQLEKEEKELVKMLDGELEELKEDLEFNKRITVGPGRMAVDKLKTLYSSYFYPQGLGPYRPKDLAQMISPQELYSIVLATVAFLGQDYARAVGDALITGLKYRSERGDGIPNPRLEIVSEYQHTGEKEDSGCPEIL